MNRKSLRNVYQKFGNDQSGITGLETAIVLIAFVVVAAVFAFTVLTTGLFTSEKAKETAMAGVATTSSSLNVKGGVIAHADAGGLVDYLRIKIAAAGTKEVLFTPADVLITYADENNLAIIPFNAQDITDDQSILDCVGAATNGWCLRNDGNNDQNLDPGEVIELIVTLDHLAPRLGPNTALDMEIIPPDGAVFKISKRTPLTLKTVNNLN
tara:strand:- start:14620 stop:15252 length:633 start_codon:yes stop_codon:yes gene_type:complete